MNRSFRFLMLACGALAAGPTLAADDAAVLACRALPDAASRLACYDAIPVAGPAGRSLAAPAAATASPSVPAAAPEQRFGLRPEVKKQKDVEPASIRSTVVGRFEGWTPGSMITLANGQVWKVTDDSDAVLSVMQDPPVTITRGLLGAYFLQVDGRTTTARVARVK